ncbi:hypothetical protein K490DRAFT_57503 [Saccharata proteae CBS 121410]|uniref:CFEM domain-containing protein n=1 Tax=Saccharata proteae CBS 121410 TaxID=1314787 RepID=A0A9P4HTR5_9PEZI|nr:hypothetical protein K490DRAFT_57503 [Saccharata proteae CBS 121410]
MLAPILLVAGFASAAIAQAGADLTKIPTCAQTSLINAIATSGCSFTDGDCLCSKVVTSDSLQAAVKAACSTDDYNKVLAYSASSCPSASSSAAPASSTEAASSSAAPATSASSSVAAASPSTASSIAPAAAGDMTTDATSAMSTSPMTSSTTSIPMSTVTGYGCSCATSATASSVMTPSTPTTPTTPGQSTPTTQPYEGAAGEVGETRRWCVAAGMVVVGLFFAEM